jgi:hypothetical protein
MDVSTKSDQFLSQFLGRLRPLAQAGLGVEASGQATEAMTRAFGKQAGRFALRLHVLHSDSGAFDAVCRDLRRQLRPESREAVMVVAFFGKAHSIELRDELAELASLTAETASPELMHALAMHEIAKILVSALIFGDSGGLLGEPGALSAFIWAMCRRRGRNCHGVRWDDAYDQIFPVAVRRPWIFLSALLYPSDPRDPQDPKHTKKEPADRVKALIKSLANNQRPENPLWNHDPIDHHGVFGDGVEPVSADPSMEEAIDQARDGSGSKLSPQEQRVRLLAGLRGSDRRDIRALEDLAGESPHQTSRRISAALRAVLVRDHVDLSLETAGLLDHRIQRALGRHLRVGGARLSLHIAQHMWAALLTDVPTTELLELLKDRRALDGWMPEVFSDACEMVAREQLPDRRLREVLSLLGSSAPFVADAAVLLRDYGAAGGALLQPAQVEDIYGAISQSIDQGQNSSGVAPAAVARLVRGRDRGLALAPEPLRAVQALLLPKSDLPRQVCMAHENIVRTAAACVRVHRAVEKAPPSAEEFRRGVETVALAVETLQEE